MSNPGRLEGVEAGQGCVQDDKKGLSDAGKAFVTLALTMDAQQRPSVTDLLEHPWLKMFTKKPAFVANEMGRRSFKKLDSIRSPYDSEQE